MATRPMKLIATYTIQDGWTNDSNGNSSIAWETIMKPAIEGDTENINGQANIYIGIAENNTDTSSYKFDCMLYEGVTSTGDLAPSSYFVTIRANRLNVSRGAVLSRSLRASAGTVVKIYRVFTSD